MSEHDLITRLRERIDVLIDERDHYRELAEQRKARVGFYRSRAHDFRKSRDYWKQVAGARIRERLAA